MKYLILYMGFFTFLFGCRNESNKSNNPANDNALVLEEITSRINKEEGWNDIFLKIISTSTTDSTKKYVCKGLYKGKTVGFQVEMRSDIGAGITPAGELNSKTGFIANAVKLSGIGNESNELIKALSELYGMPTSKPFIQQTNWLTAFSLNQKSVDLDQMDYYKLKIFFDQDENLYSELFLNINTKNREIELHEKDEGYREGVIANLTK